MPELPNKIYLSRSDVARALGGRRQLEAVERQGLLARHYPAGYVRARYVRGEVKKVIDALATSAS